AAVGLVDVYAVPIGWWRTNGVVAYFHDHLGYDYHGTGEHPAQAGLPENFVYNVGGDRPFLRRLVSTFLSPLASSYLFVVALLVAVAGLRRPRPGPPPDGRGPGVVFPLPPPGPPPPALRFVWRSAS